jgi:signal transduction histidine kinase
MGEMLGNVAHQWRQPLNALGLVLANIQDASRCGALDAGTVEEAVADGNQVLRGMSETIRVFLDFFRPAKAKLPFSALGQIRETLALVEATNRHAGVSVEIDAGADLPLFGFANEYSQVLLNLLSNARQAIEAARPVPGRVTLRLEKRAGLGCLTVRDNGGGISEEIMEKLFEPYFTTKQGGTGIGLHMSRQIVERSFGGRIEVRNVPGGAEFSVLTPLHEGSDEPLAPPA